MARRRWIATVLALCGVAVSLMQTVVVPVLPQLPGLTGGSPSDVSWLVTIILLTGALAMPLLGRAGDMYGKRRVLLGALVVLLAGSVICAVTLQLAWLIVGRGLQGVGLAVVPLGISILRDEMPPERLAPAVAMMSVTVGLGAIVGQPTAGIVVQYAGIHALFWVCTVTSAAALLLVAVVVPESSRRTGGRFDLAGALSLSAGLTCFLLAVTKAAEWDAGVIAVLLASAAAWAAVFGWSELRVAEPLISLRQAGRRSVLPANLATLFIGFAFYTNSLSTALLVQEPKATGYGVGASVAVAGLCMLPGGITMVLLSPLSARLCVTRGPKLCVLVATATITFGYGLRVLFIDDLWTIMLGATVVASGTAIAYSAVPILLMRAVPIGDTGAANGLNTLLRLVGQSVSSAVTAAVLSGLTMRYALGDGAGARRLSAAVRDRGGVRDHRFPRHHVRPGSPAGRGRDDDDLTQIRQ